MIRNWQRGTALIEFVLGFLIFWMVFIGVFEFGRVMLAWNAASEATRMAARVASICTRASKTAISNKVIYLLQFTGQVNYQDQIGLNADVPDWLQLEYFPQNCDDSNCEQVQARLSGLTFKLQIPGWKNMELILPENRVTVMREGMSKLNYFQSFYNSDCR